jgi:hypothetical protein
MYDFDKYSDKLKAARPLEKEFLDQKVEVMTQPVTLKIELPNLTNPWIVPFEHYRVAAGDRTISGLQTAAEKAGFHLRIILPDIRESDAPPDDDRLNVYINKTPSGDWRIQGFSFC